MILAIEIAILALILAVFVAIVLTGVFIIKLPGLLDAGWRSKIEPGLLAAIAGLRGRLEALTDSSIEINSRTVEAQGIALETLAQVSSLSNQSWRALTDALLRADEAALEGAARLAQSTKTADSIASDLQEVVKGLVSEVGRLEAVSTTLAAYKPGEQLASLVTLTSASSMQAAAASEQVLANFSKIRRRAIHEMVSAHPRRVQVYLHPSKTKVTVPHFENSGIVHIPALADEIGFRLVCESTVCRHIDGKKRYESKTLYHLDGPSTISAKLIPPGMLVGQLSDAADIIGVAELIGKPLKELAEGNLPVLFVSVVFGLPHPVQVATYVVVKDAFGFMLDRFRREADRRAATEELWRELSGLQFNVREIGGLAHTQLGRFIGDQDAERETPNGGLTRILDSEDTYRWVCQSDARSFVNSLAEDGVSSGTVQ